MRRLLATIGAFALLGSRLAVPGAVSALPSATVTLTASPNPSVTTSTFKIVVKLSAPASNVVFTLETSGGFEEGSCSPSANCEIIGLANFPRWTYATASGTLTATFTTTVHPSMVVRFYSVEGISVNSPPALRMKSPTVTTTVTRSPTGVVMPGDTIHVTVNSTTNAGPMTGRQWVELPTSGVSTPTNLSDGAQFESWGAVDRWTTLDPSATFNFDIEVTAAIGTKLAFKGYFEAYDASTSMSFTVGVAPTPRPTATPKATKSPTAAPSAAPSAMPTASAAPTALASAPSPSGSVEPSPAASIEPTAAASVAPAPSGPPETAQAGTPGGAFMAGLAIVLVGGLIVVGGLRLRINRRGLP